MTGRSNPWLDTVLSTEPTPSEPIPPPPPSRDTPSKKTESPVTRQQSSSIQKTKRTDSPVTRPRSSSSRQPNPSKSPARNSLDEAFKAAIKAIVPEREAAARKARLNSNGTTTTTTNTHIKTITPIPHLPPKPKVEPELRKAIDRLTLNRLRSVVYKTLDSSPQARAIFEKEVLTAPPIDSGVDEETAELERKKAGKRRPRFEMCRLCKSEFNVTENVEGGCVHHSGELEPDERAWRDHDVTEDGPIDTTENKENHPDCFRWDCCSGEGDDDGCETTAHEADEAFNPKRPKR